MLAANLAVTHFKQSGKILSFPEAQSKVREVYFQNFMAVHNRG